MQGHLARLCQTPPDYATQAVDEKGDTDEESSEEGDVCGVGWECGFNGAGDKDDDILGIGWESTEQSKAVEFDLGGVEHGQDEC